MTRSRGLKHELQLRKVRQPQAFKQIWPDQGDWNTDLFWARRPFFANTFKQIWPDQGDWNDLPCALKPFFANTTFKQIWPDQGDWNELAAIVPRASLTYLNKFDPIKGIETILWDIVQVSGDLNLNKFDPIKGIETFISNSRILLNITKI